MLPWMQELYLRIIRDGESLDTIIVHTAGNAYEFINDGGILGIVPNEHSKYYNIRKFFCDYNEYFSKLDFLQRVRTKESWRSKAAMYTRLKNIAKRNGIAITTSVQKEIDLDNIRFKAIDMDNGA